VSVAKAIGLPIAKRCNEVHIKYKIHDGFTYTSGEGLSTSHYSYYPGLGGVVPQECERAVSKRLYDLVFAKAKAKSRGEEIDRLAQKRLDQILA